MAFDTHAFHERCECRWCVVMREIVADTLLAPPVGQAERASIYDALRRTVVPGSEKIPQ